MDLAEFPPNERAAIEIIEQTPSASTIRSVFTEEAIDKLIREELSVEDHEERKTFPGTTMQPLPSASSTLTIPEWVDSSDTFRQPHNEWHIDQSSEVQYIIQSRYGGADYVTLPQVNIVDKKTP
ncbi:hypothetical protein QR680_013889 [Steinernema hermaphroditum]|uniref:Uncharacterized protein n=1 Tax=Steinernema hermaphroditum TaxID=289476 RepID=A0AA39I713_9BILA|nr:hypothetical protein QR680_013889 [Steinernema hermaphroditum]